MEKDLVDYVYLSDNLRYADLFNGVLFGGEEVINADRLRGEDTKLVIASKDKKKGRYRDVIRKYEGDVSYAILGIENQEAVDYTMPLRIMEYETGAYTKQVSEIEKHHTDAKDVKGDAYLCKFKKTDKLSPCVTLVLYWGDLWDGPECMKDILNTESIPEKLRPYVNDYRLHLVNVRSFSDTDVFKTDLKLVFDFMKQVKSRAGMRELLLSNEAYRTVSRDAYEIMRVHTNLNEFDKYIEARECKQEEVDMCQAIREIIEEERTLARIEGLRQGLEEGREEGREQGREQGLVQGILLQTYRMVERGRMSVREALEDNESNQTERDFIESMIKAGFKMPE